MDNHRGSQFIANLYHVIELQLLQEFSKCTPCRDKSIFMSSKFALIAMEDMNPAMADFKYGVAFNTHGNTNGSVYPSPLTHLGQHRC